MSKICNCMATVLLLAVFWLADDAVAQSSWKDLAGGLFDNKEESTPEQTGIEALTEEERSGGLKDALKLGTLRAVDTLGAAGGYLDDPQVRIPLPDSLDTVASGLRMLGQGKVVDDFTTTLNRAAEAAVPEAAAIFGDAIAAMSIQDASQILTGPDDAATSYFRDHTGQALAEAMQPIVAQATAQTGVTSAYKNLVQRAGPAVDMLQPGALDLDQYVTDKALDGLFVKLAEQERLIRENPAAHGTELLQKVFGSIQR